MFGEGMETLISLVSLCFKEICSAVVLLICGLAASPREIFKISTEFVVLKVWNGPQINFFKHPNQFLCVVSFGCKLLMFVPMLARIKFRR